MNKEKFTLDNDKITLDTTCMSDNSYNEALEIIEVPPELRGSSDEEILKMSEKVLREVSGKRKKGERRPSKRRRLELKAEKQLQEAQNAAREIFGNPTPKINSLDGLGMTGFMTSANIFCAADSSAKYTKSVEEPKPVVRRVLKASFGSKIAEKPKTVTVSAAELAKQRAEERAKKIREALLAKKKEM
ncbi:hypothetical protein [Fibrobacter sp. UWEL]|uniref:hypothetical protein n=1 Tax=Fibrobacter sp. UWEL TaxID=1896209 RepID=UPI0009218FC9|nr:hypothetical protein [Fibrobacter sp. UWEL]SHL10122.1 hypothetical protein SAMN05720468_11383 [Fibrobacter sp. UWEL]